MKYVSEFRDPQAAARVAARIRAQVDPGKTYRLLEFCGGHTHAIYRHGLPDLLPANVRFVHGPGCPVCILPASRIRALIDFAEREPLTVCTYGDVLRVPAQGKNLESLRSRGCDLRVVYSPLDCLALARQTPARRIVFFAVGFETTAPATAALIQSAAAEGLSNLLVYCNHVCTDAALAALLTPTQVTRRGFDGILGPSHVSTITGTDLYEPFAERHRMPITVAGFEPLDILLAAEMLIAQINRGTWEVENEYTRAVSRTGNRRAQALMSDVFRIREQFEWRGLGVLPASGLAIAGRYAGHDAERQLGLPEVLANDVKSCACPAVLRGEMTPRECRLFGSVCRPDNPMGACMVSSEGACAAEWQYRRTG